MRARWTVGLAIAAWIVAAMPVGASPTGGGITRKDMADFLQSQGLSAKIEDDTLGNSVVKTTADGVNFAIYFFDCDAATARCQAIQFAAGWTITKPPKAAMLNGWNRDMHFVRAYVTKDNKALYGEMDLTVAPGGTTEQIADYLKRWRKMLAEFKRRFGVGQ